MFDVFYYKPKNKTFLESLEKTVANIQNYVPIYRAFFDLNETNYNRISFNHKHHIVDYNKIVAATTDAAAAVAQPRECDIFIKYSPVLDPIKYMIGKYQHCEDKLHILPKYNSTEEMCIPKMLDVNNSSYVDGFFTYLTSQLLHHHAFVNGVDYYGSFMGIQREFKMNILEDYSYLLGSDFFRKNRDKLFAVENQFGDDMTAAFAAHGTGSRNHKTKLETTDEIVEIVADEIIDGSDIGGGGGSGEAAVCGELVVEYERGGGAVAPPTEEIHIVGGDGGNDDNSVSTNSSNNSSVNYTSEEEEDPDKLSDGDMFEDMTDENEISDDISSVSEETDETDDTREIIATIYNYPVQLICLEKCTGTLDHLMTEGLLSDIEWAAALFQVIMSLAVYQKSFFLTHNDLHTNNIMYVETTHKYIYYKINNRYFKVPTYHRIYKIIDFGRAIYTYRGKLFCSDSFDFHGDAATQYNFPPYYNDKKPIIEPNYSFDLCRLACSIYDCLIDPDEEDATPRGEIARLIHEWCLDDNGKNVLYMRDGEERYPNFKLYKMIARTVHKHTPFNQLNRKVFRRFEVRATDKTQRAVAEAALFVDVDSIPCYAAVPETAQI